MELTLEEFISKYSDYANVIASKFISEVKDYGIDFDDLYQTGCLVLVESYHRYDKQKASYSTFAYTNIYYGILNYINNNCYITHVPDSVEYLARYLRKKQVKFFSKYGRNMTLDESLEVLNNCSYNYNTVINREYILMLEQVSMFQYRKQFYYGSYCTESYDLYDGKVEENVPFDELIISEENVEEKAVNNVFMSEIRTYLDNFSDTKKNIFIDLTGLDDDVWKTLREVGEKYNMSHQSANNNYKKVLKKVRTKFK